MAKKYICVNGHDRCYGGASAGPECPTCEVRNPIDKSGRTYYVSGRGEKFELFNQFNEKSYLYFTGTRGECVEMYKKNFERPDTNLEYR